MQRGRFEKPKQGRFPWLTVALAILVVVLCILLLQKCGGAPIIPGETTVPETTVIKNEGTISIPGYELLELQSDSKQQALCLPNPPQNNCYFQITLYLEDGTMLWQSELIEPGETSQPLVLSRELKKGYYPGAFLRFACYRMDEDRTPLNGAETKVTLWVK